MKKLFIIVILLVLCSVSYAAESEEAQSKTATKIEAFAAKAGTVIIRGITAAGTVKGNYNGQISVDAREYQDASNPKAKEYGISIQVKESGRIERSNTSYIDYDEISSLLAGIDYISKADNKITPMNNFEATYKTRGDFRITTFSALDGISAGVTSGVIGRTSVFMTLADMNALRDIIIKAKDLIDAARKAR
jgi:hypothetical protein